MNSNLKVIWHDHRREPKCPPNPDFPEGKDIDLSAGEPMVCTTQLPYPAKRCGMFIVACGCCGLTVGITTAGRPDDPRSVIIPCRHQPEGAPVPSV
jgi:hypothetical protein